MRTLLLATTLVVLTTFAHGGEPGAKDWKRIAGILERDGRPDSLVATALIHYRQLRDPGGAVSALDRALALDPKQPDVAWLALSICTTTTGCDSGPRVASLRELEPRNAAGYDVALKRAQASGDAAGEDAALAAIAESAAYDIYWSRLIVRTSDALAQPLGRGGRPLRPLNVGAVEATGWIAASGIQGLASISTACKGDRLKRPEVVAQCRKVAHVLDNGDTYLVAMFGRGIAKRLWAPEDAEFADFREHARQYEYALEMTRPYSNAADKSVEETRRMMDRHRAHRREQDVFREWLVDLKLPPDPPPGWEPATPASPK